MAHHQPDKPCSTDHKPHAPRKDLLEELDIYEEAMGIRALSPRKIKELIASYAWDNEQLRGDIERLSSMAREDQRIQGDEIRFLKVEKMRLEREVSELKRKLYGHDKE